MWQHINFITVDFLMGGLRYMIPLACQEHLQNDGGEEHQAIVKKSSAHKLEGKARLEERR
jgi:hypothetical protein